LKKTKLRLNARKKSHAKIVSRSEGGGNFEKGPIAHPGREDPLSTKRGIVLVVKRRNRRKNEKATDQSLGMRWGGKRKNRPRSSKALV